MASLQYLCVRADASVLDRNFCAQRLEALQMEVDRSGTDIASAGKRNLRFLVFAKQCAEKIVACADLFDVFILDIHIADVCSAQYNAVSVSAVDLHADLDHSFKHDVDVPNVRKILDQNLLIRHDRRGKNTERGILRAADLYFTVQRSAASDYILFHTFSSSVTNYSAVRIIP